MDPKATKVTLTISLADLEVVIKRAVREAVREELARLLRAPARSRTEGGEHEEPDDSEGDGELLSDALALSQQYRKNNEGWKSWEEFKEELTRAEAAGELPD